MRPFVSTLCALLFAFPTAAQVVRDGSIGPGTPLIVASGLDPNDDFADYLITDALGETSGGSLFHSFDTFSIAAGEVATFTGPASIDTIVSRTTGAQGSFLFGTLRSTIAQAQLFLLSPGGLVIGEGAHLDVPGSVHLSTANVLRFGPNPAFDLPTDSLARPPVLSSMPPSAFGFGPSPASISLGVVDPSDPTQALSVPPGETLSLVGGAITFTGIPAVAPFFFQGDIIGAPGANVEIASTSGNQDVPLREVAGRSRLDLDQLPPDLLDGEVLLQQNARIDVGVPAGGMNAAGSVIVRAGRFRIIDGRIEATHRSDVEDAGVFDIGTRDAIELDQARLTSFTAAAGRGSDIILDSESVIFSGDSLIRVLSNATGESGDLTVAATTISVAEGTEISSLNTGAGAGGDIEFLARDGSGNGTIEIRGDGESPAGLRLPSVLFSNPRADGVGGAIRLEADSITVSDNGEILSITRGSAAATGGPIEIETANLVVESGSFVSSSTEGNAAGGAVSVRGLDGAATNRVLIRNAGTESQPARISTNTISNTVGAGSGGDVSIRADSVELIDGGQIFARTEGAGNAGALVVLSDAIRIAGVLANPSDPDDPFRAGITSRVGDAGALGNGTLLSLDTRILDVENGGQVSTATFGVGDAGDLQITARERMTLGGGTNGASLVSAQTVAGPTSPGGGRGGVITIDTDQLELVDGGQITASTAALGNPGSVGDAGDVVIAANRVEISGAAGFDVSGIFSKSDSAATSGIGDGGDVTIRVDGDLVLADGGKLEVSSSGDGDAGNIQVDVSGTVEMSSGSQILSVSGASSTGSAGSIGVVAVGDVMLGGGSEISASTGAQSTGGGGVVDVQSGRDVQLTGASGIRSRSDGFGDAGDIGITANRFLAAEGSAVSTEANAASGGSITVDAAEIFELADSSATTSVQGALTSDAGNIFIRTPGLVVVDRSAIVAQAVQGSGGRIEIFSSSSFISGDSVISASSEAGPQGVVALTPPEDALISELASLPAALEDPSQFLRNACDLRTEREGSFTVNPRPAAAAPPDQFLHAPLAPAEPSSATCTQ